MIETYPRFDTIYSLPDDTIDRCPFDRRGRYGKIVLGKNEGIAILEVRVRVTVKLEVFIID
jgi:hypothetical protein